jgi:hypothetical protein
MQRKRVDVVDFRKRQGSPGFHGGWSPHSAFSTPPAGHCCPHGHFQRDRRELTAVICSRPPSSGAATIYMIGHVLSPSEIASVSEIASLANR